MLKRRICDPLNINKYLLLIRSTLYGDFGCQCLWCAPDNLLKGDKNYVIECLLRVFVRLDMLRCHLQKEYICK